MRRAAEGLVGLPRPRAVYTDLDGTLFGPGGSLFAAPGGGVTRRAAEAVAAVLQAGAALVPISGRTADQVREAARVVGATDFIAELGGITCYDLGAEVVRDYGAFEGEGTPHDAMARQGAAGLLLEAFPGRLEPHTPWARLPRECSMLLRGLVDPGAARSLLADAGLGWLDLLDNGVIPRSYPTLPVEEVHAYHLLPRGVTKATAVAADMARRGLAPEECVALGDSPSDASLAGAVGAVFIVANGRAAVERAGAPPENVYATEGSHGEGFAEVVEALFG